MDWSLLRRKSHSKARLYLSFTVWSEDRTEEHLSEFLRSLVPLINWVLDNKFAWVSEQDRDSIIGFVLFKISRKMDYFCNRPLKQFCSLMWTVIKRMVIDYFKTHDYVGREDHKINSSDIIRKSQYSVAKKVDAKLILEDLPNQITAFAVSRDRFRYGVNAIRSAVHLLVAGEKIPHSMLRNWYGIKNPERFVAFVVLMCRLYMSIYRGKYEMLLDDASYTFVDEVGRRVSVVE